MRYNKEEIKFFNRIAKITNSILKTNESTYEFKRKIIDIMIIFIDAILRSNKDRLFDAHLAIANYLNEDKKYMKEFKAMHKKNKVANKNSLLSLAHSRKKVKIF